MGLKDLLLQKGWAGTTISRSETVERFNPLIRAHIHLNRYYDFAVKTISDSAVTTALAKLQHDARMQVNKMCETVFSNGGVAYSGTDVSPEDFVIEGDEDDILFRLFDMESNFRNAILAEGDIEHHMRSRAIFLNVEQQSSKRLDYLKEQTKRRRRKTAAA